MEKISREQVKKIFKKVKNIRFPKDFDESNFENLKYLGWIDETDQVLYTLMDYKGNLEGIRWEIAKSGKVMKKAMCDICNTSREFGEVMFVSAQTRKRPKNVDYRTRGKYICVDSKQCNKDLQKLDKLEEFFSMIIDQE